MEVAIGARYENGLAGRGEVKPGTGRREAWVHARDEAPGSCDTITNSSRSTPRFLFGSLDDARRVPLIYRLRRGRDP